MILEAKRQKVTKMKHNMESEIIGTIEYDEPYQWEFVYSDNRRRVFENVIRFNSMKTGCYVLFDSDGVAYVIRPEFEVVIQKPMVSDKTIEGNK